MENKLQISSTHNSHSKIAAVLSALFMGLGQIYNKQYIKGILLSLSKVLVLVFFSRPIIDGLYGLITLGETPQVRQRGRIIEQGDHSILLMAEGLLLLFLLIAILFVYYFNIRDAYQIGKLREQGKAIQPFKATMKNVWENGFAYILITPTALFMVLLTVFPLIFTALIAFTNYSSPNYLPPANLVDWVGLQQFVRLFTMESWRGTFIGVFSWTIIWATLSTVMVVFFGLFVAVVLSQKVVKFTKFWRNLFILPWAVPGFVTILIFRSMYNGQYGIINDMLRAVGLNGIPWLSDPLWAKVAVLLTNLWLGFPFWMALFTAILTTISKELYEAAQVDGATIVQQFRKITFPIVMVAAVPLMVFTFAFNFNQLTFIYLMTEGGPTNSNYNFAGHTDILLSWIFKMTLDNGQYAIASAVALLVFLIIACFAYFNLKNTKSMKGDF
ncbi:sugar ABC transporter permease [Anaerobacillus alkalidiazotrophicus]|uniref:Maltose/maltodextrin transport system permease protein n=1 Tax=Anaerobacillus alkalidiazotrophicus TaxID=472963 RepID=A0A1S2M163_9BACI|nr:sugar ABC transporter permease [Anaerobacillus alkalidiazotrophicus]OIJ18438.1 sugar ABC transporter permease [Anaerobacillus alkalidiazotrophicus]OIJ19917.1 sugar ABC transporter permease [Anaerobacillus alkalidiazotrophicus]